jgi:hypothetical protein
LTAIKVCHEAASFQGHPGVPGRRKALSDHQIGLTEGLLNIADTLLQSEGRIAPLLREQERSADSAGGFYLNHRRMWSILHYDAFEGIFRNVAILRNNHR